jgi:hypothetical protein
MQELRVGDNTVHIKNGGNQGFFAFFHEITDFSSFKVGGSIPSSN